PPAVTARDGTSRLSHAALETDSAHDVGAGFGLSAPGRYAHHAGFCLFVAVLAFRLHSADHRHSRLDGEFLCGAAWASDAADFETDWRRLAGWGRYDIRI